VPCRVGSTKAHTLLRDMLDAGERPSPEQRDQLLLLEETLRKTSICGLGQVALGPVASVLGLDKGGAAARDQPKPGGAPGQPDR
jgi:formate dehydrogenase/NADH-quinone oxidoreductase subunit F